MHAVAFAINRTKWKFAQFYDDILRFIGLTDARLRLLITIQDSEAPYEKELAFKLGITRQTVSQTLDAVVGLGFAERVEGVMDRRRNYVYLTPKGREVLRRVYAIYVRSGIARKIAARAFIDIPVAPEKIPHVLERLRDPRFAFGERSTFRPRVAANEEIDSGEPLEGDDRVIFDRVVRYCRKRFNHLPWEYIMST
jgi:DNA-binding MarR family transcriptional regulator